MSKFSTYLLKIVTTFLLLLQDNVQLDSYDKATNAVEDSARSWFDGLSFLSNVETYSAVARSIESAMSNELMFKKELSGKLLKSPGFLRLSILEDHDEHFENQFSSFEFFAGNRVKLTLVASYRLSASETMSPELHLSHGGDPLPRKVRVVINPLLIAGGVFGGTVRSGYLLSPKTYEIWNEPGFHKENFEPLAREVIFKPGRLIVRQKAKPKVGEFMSHKVTFKYFDGVPALESIQFKQGDKQQVQTLCLISGYRKFGESYIPTIGREIRKQQISVDGVLQEGYLVTESRFTDVNFREMHEESHLLELPKNLHFDAGLSAFVKSNSKLDFIALDECLSNPKAKSLLTHRKKSLYELVPIEPNSNAIIVCSAISGILGLALLAIGRRIRISR